MRKVRGILFVMGLALVCFPVGNVYAQCPVNIGFEKGDFTGWQCYGGTITRGNGLTLYPTAPEGGQHEVVARNESNDLDPIGRFPINPPNGSSRYVVLGDIQGGSRVAQATYTFTIPTNAIAYSIVYHYAVVLNNPDHTEAEQPKFTAKVYNVSRNEYVTCSSFEYTASGALPGFQTAGAYVYKPWAAVTINLNQHAGEVIRLEFTTNDCIPGGHGGYAYIDVDQNCSSPVRGSVLCVGDTTMKLTGLYGFESYRWFNADFSELLGTNDTLEFASIPPIGTKIALEVKPYPGFGCTDTLYTTIDHAVSKVNVDIADAETVCAQNGIDITDPALMISSSPGLEFSYYRDSALTHTLPWPQRITESGEYYVKGTDQYGCFGQDKISVLAIPSYTLTVEPNPPEITRPDVFDLTSLVTPQSGVQFYYWKNANATIPVPDPLNVDSSGVYYIEAVNGYGCTSTASTNVVVKDMPPLLTSMLPNAFSPNNDGINDVWELPILQLYPNCVVDIFSREGRLLYRSPGYQHPWDGTYQGKPVPVGTYYYIIKLNNKRQGPIGGSVTVVR